MINEYTQVCKKCGEEKVFDLFFRVKALKSGYSTRCKSCTSIAARAYWSKNKSKIAVQRKAFRSENLERLSETNKEWHNNNKEWAREYSKKYSEENKEKIKERTKKYCEDNKEKIQQRAWEYRKKNKDKLDKISAEYRRNGKAVESWGRSRRKYPKRFKARCAVYIAIKSGKLIRPDSCEKCGVKCKPDSHHKDYNFQLDVDFLCKPCHGLWHRNNEVID